MITSCASALTALKFEFEYDYRYRKYYVPRVFSLTHHSVGILVKILQAFLQTPQTTDTTLQCVLGAGVLGPLHPEKRIQHSERISVKLICPTNCFTDVSQ
jgi:hypothetical protein